MNDASCKIAECEHAPVIESRAILLSILLLSGLLAIYTAFELAHLFASTEQRPLTDFNAFYLVGTMYWEGTLEQAYHVGSMLEAQHRLYRFNSFMPWTYPPQFDFVAAGLALLPFGVAYFAFVFASFASYCLILQKLSKKHFGAALLSIAPAIFLTIRCGQNGFLTGALVGLFSLALVHGRSSAGLPLGLMVIKPHLAIGIAALSVVSKRWHVLTVASVILLLSSVVATLAFGHQIWPAFLGGVKEASQFLQLGLYPLFRMSSLYATFRTLGAPSEVALAAQGIGALTAISLIVIAYSKNYAPRRVTGIAVLATLCISPYCYDYDLPILGVSAALLIDDIDRFARNLEKSIMLALSWVAGGWGLAQSFIADHLSSESAFPPADQPGSVGGVILLLLLVMVIFIIRRAERFRAADQVE